MDLRHWAILDRSLLVREAAISLPENHDRNRFILSNITKGRLGRIIVSAAESGAISAGLWAGADFSSGTKIEGPYL
jgi:hypothetical protein